MVSKVLDEVHALAESGTFRRVVETSSRVVEIHPFRDSRRARVHDSARPGTARLCRDVRTESWHRAIGLTRNGGGVLERVGHSAMRRTWLFIAVGLFWAFRSLQSFSDPNFYDPDNLNDWLALGTYSVAMWLLAPAILLLPQAPAARWPARLAAAAAVVVGLTNVIEDGLGVDPVGIVYGLGGGALLLSLVAMTAVCLVRPPRWAALVLVATVVGMLQLENGGGVVVLAAWWFAAWKVGRTASRPQARTRP